jgi:ATP-dependent Clp protease protease subunit
MGGLSGQASDIDIQAQEILKIRELLTEILVRHTGQSPERIKKDTDRDFFMSANAAKEYGIIDEVITRHDEAESS